MREIELTLGKKAIIDDEDYESVSQIKWHALKAKKTYYAEGYIKVNGRRKKISMHKYIINDPSAIIIDHADRNGLHNWRDNLRASTYAQNNANRTPSGISKYRGVHLKTRKYKNKSGIESIYTYWCATIMIDGKTKYLGYFKTEEEAAICYNIAAKEQYGEWAFINNINDGANSNQNNNHFLIAKGDTINNQNIVIIESAS